MSKILSHPGDEIRRQRLQSSIDAEPSGLWVSVSSLTKENAALRKCIADLEFDNRALKAKAERMGEVISGGIDEAAKRIEELEAALVKIRDEEGRVCDAYEVCDHRACESSYRSWVIADDVLAHKEVKA